MAQNTHSKESNSASPPSIDPQSTRKADDYVFIRVLRASVKQGQSRHFILEAERLRSSNALFKHNMSTSAWKEQARRPRVLLLDEDELVVALFVSYLRHGTIDRSLIGQEDPYIMLFNAQRLAVSWEDNDFQNAVLDAIAACAIDGVQWNIMLPKMVWEIEPAGSRFRALILDIYIKIGKLEWLDVAAQEGLTGDFVIELVREFIKRRDSPPKYGAVPLLSERCKYHVHQQGQKCGQQERDGERVVEDHTTTINVIPTTELVSGNTSLSPRSSSLSSSATSTHSSQTVDLAEQIHKATEPLESQTKPPETDCLERLTSVDDAHLSPSTQSTNHARGTSVDPHTQGSDTTAPLTLRAKTFESSRMDQTMTSTSSSPTPSYVPTLPDSSQTHDKNNALDETKDEAKDKITKTNDYNTDAAQTTPSKKTVKALAIKQENISPTKRLRDEDQSNDSGRQRKSPKKAAHGDASSNQDVVVTKVVRATKPKTQQNVVRNTIRQAIVLDD